MDFSGLNLNAKRKWNVRSKKFRWDYECGWEWECSVFFRCFITKLNIHKKCLILMIAQIGKLGGFYCCYYTLLACTIVYVNEKWFLKTEWELMNLIITWACDSISQLLRLFPFHFGDNSLFCTIFTCYITEYIPFIYLFIFVFRFNCIVKVSTVNSDRHEKWLRTFSL